MVASRRIDVDDTVDGVGAPESAAGSANDFDAVDVLEQGILDVPPDASEKRVVDEPAVDQDQHFVVKNVAEAARRNDPHMSALLREVQTGDHAQRVGNGGKSTTADVFAGEDEDRRGGARKVFGFLGGGSDLDIHEVFEALAGEIARLLLRPRGRRDRS
jgi:hypothetical protein